MWREQRSRTANLDMPRLAQCMDDALLNGTPTVDTAAHRVTVSTLHTQHSVVTLLQQRHYALTAIWRTATADINDITWPTTANTHHRLTTSESSPQILLYSKKKQKMVRSSDAQKRSNMSKPTINNHLSTNMPYVQTIIHRGVVFWKTRYLHVKK